MTWSTAPCTIRSLTVGTPNGGFSWLPGLGIHTRLTACGWYWPVLSSCSSFWIVCSWRSPTRLALCLSIPALPPLATTFCSDPARFSCLQTLSINRNHLPPSIPVSRVANNALGPDRWFHPCPPGSDFSPLLSRRRHCRGLLFLRSVFHASTFLPPLAPRVLPPLPRYYGGSVTFRARFFGPSQRP